MPSDLLGEMRVRNKGWWADGGRWWSTSVKVEKEGRVTQGEIQAAGWFRGSSGPIVMLFPRKYCSLEESSFRRDWAGTNAPIMLSHWQGLILLGSMVLVQSQGWKLGSVNNAPSLEPGLLKALSFTHPWHHRWQLLPGFYNGWMIHGKY